MMPVSRIKRTRAGMVSQSMDQLSTNLRWLRHWLEESSHYPEPVFDGLLHYTTLTSHAKERPFLPFFVLLFKYTLQVEILCIKVSRVAT